jgi:phenylacetate-CoA ligase
LFRGGSQVVASKNYADLVGRQLADVADGLFSAVRRLGWSADRLAADRERRLRDLLAWSASRSAFHTERLREVDIDRFTEADLPSLPIMTRADLMGQFDRVITDPALSLEAVNSHVDSLEEDDYLLDEYRVIATSGSTGARGLLVYGWEDWTTFALIATRWRVGQQTCLSRPAALARCSHPTRGTCPVLSTPFSRRPPVKMCRR